MVKWLISTEWKRLVRHPGDILLPLLFLLLSIIIIGLTNKGTTQVNPSVFLLLLTLSILTTKPAFTSEQEQLWYQNCLLSGISKQTFFWISSIVLIGWFLVVLLVVLLAQSLLFTDALQPPLPYVSAGIIVCAVLWLNAGHTVTNGAPGLLLPLIILPLMIPGLLFGMGILTMDDNGAAISYFLAYILFTTAITPWIAR